MHITVCKEVKESVQSGLFYKNNNSDVPERFSICASDYSRHEFQVLLSPMSTSFGLPNAEWKEFDVWTAHKRDKFLDTGVARLKTKFCFFLSPASFNEFM